MRLVSSPLSPHEAIFDAPYNLKANPLYTHFLDQRQIPGKKGQYQIAVAYVMPFFAYFPPNTEQGSSEKYAVVVHVVDEQGDSAWEYIGAFPNLEEAKRVSHVVKREYRRAVLDSIAYSRKLKYGVKPSGPKKKVVAKREFAKRLTKRTKKVTRR